MSDWEKLFYVGVTKSKTRLGEIRLFSTKYLNMYFNMKYLNKYFIINWKNRLLDVLLVAFLKNRYNVSF